MKDFRFTPAQIIAVTLVIAIFTTALLTCDLSQLSN